MDINTEPHVVIRDIVIWFKHVDSQDLRKRLATLTDEEGITLEVDGVLGRWLRVKTGKDGRPTEALKPEGPTKEIWSKWYRSRKGERVTIREVRTADAYLMTIASLFPEWESPQDEAAFHDL
jgi:hypothetical protein